MWWYFKFQPSTIVLVLSSMLGKIACAMLSLIYLSLYMIDLYITNMKNKSMFLFGCYIVFVLKWSRLIAFLMFHSYSIVQDRCSDCSFLFQLWTINLLCVNQAPFNIISLSCFVVYIKHYLKIYYYLDL